jgi:multidrug resistance efflux pump
MTNYSLQWRPPASLPLYGLAAVVIAMTGWAYCTTIDIAVRGRGIVRPDGDVVRVAGTMPGRIQRAPLTLGIMEGAVIRRGDTLVELDDRRLRLKEMALEQQLRYAELRLAAVEEKVGSRLLLQSLEDAENSVSRREADLERPTDRPMVPKSKQPEARRKELEDERTPFLAAAAAAASDLEQCRLDLSFLKIPSPVSGTVSSLTPLHSGEFVAAGTTIATIIPATETLIVESWLSSSERGLVTPGQTTRLRVESGLSTNAPFDGVVESVSPDVRVSETGAAAYRVTVRVESPSVELLPGMTFELRFIVRHERLLWMLFQKFRQGFQSAL